jgi:hypothetical protein
LTWRSMRSMGKHGKTWTGEGWHKIYIRYNIWYMIIWYIGWHIYIGWLFQMNRIW